MHLYIIPAEDKAPQEKFIIYRPLLGLAFVGNRAMADLAVRIANNGTPEPAGDDPVDRFLASVGFYEPDPVEPRLPSLEFSPTTAVLLLTNTCQLRCIYCYAAAGEASPQTLTDEHARAAIDHVHRVAEARGRKQFEVSFHGGGEPTLAWKVMQAATEYARQKSLPAKVTLTSNGVWSVAQRAWILKNIDGLTLSMDGRPEVQDRCRPFASGKGSSAQVMESIAELDAHNFTYGIRMTAIAPWDDLPKNIRFLVENTRCRTIQVEPAFNTQRGGHGEAGEAEMLAFADAFLQAWEVAGNAGRKFHYSGARAGMRTATFCSAPFNALITDNTGNLVTCYEITGPTHPLYELSHTGYVDGTDQSVHIDQAKREHILGLINARRAACQDCFAYWTCAGDCYARAWGQGEQGYLERSSRCVLNCHLTRQLLLYLIAQHDGVWRGFIQYADTLPEPGEQVKHARHD